MLSPNRLIPTIKLAIFSILIGLAILSSNKCISQTKFKVILDADTGNEVDDLYAISRALLEPTWEITALNATHWQTAHWAVPQSMENSHRINQTILGHLGMSVKTRRGGIARMFDWGDMAQHSAAAYEIIHQAKETPEGEKLTVIALGALTNVASAIYIDPSIESKIKLYWLGTSYDFEQEVLKTTDFNCMMDIQAINILLFSSVEMHVIPVNVASAITFEHTRTAKEIKGKHPLGDYLIDRWDQHLDSGRKTRTLWDLALIEAMVYPELAETIEIQTSKDRGNRKITYYKSIQAEKMRVDFFEVMNRFFEK